MNDLQNNTMRTNHCASDVKFMSKVKNISLQERISVWTAGLRRPPEYVVKT